MFNTVVVKEFSTYIGGGGILKKNNDCKMSSFLFQQIW